MPTGQPGGHTCGHRRRHADRGCPPHPPSSPQTFRGPPEAAHEDVKSFLKGVAREALPRAPAQTSALVWVRKTDKLNS